jgi:hypothetical protein
MVEVLPLPEDLRVADKYVRFHPFLGYSICKRDDKILYTPQDELADSQKTYPEYYDNWVASADGFWLGTEIQAIVEHVCRYGVMITRNITPVVKEGTVLYSSIHQNSFLTTVLCPSVSKRDEWFTCPWEPVTVPTNAFQKMTKMLLSSTSAAAATDE